MIRRCRCGVPARYELEREGDVVLAWACETHLLEALVDLLPTDEHRDAARVRDRWNTWMPQEVGV